MKPSILITGASGLLGQALVRQFLDNGFFVWAQYHTKPLARFEPVDIKWIPADFATLAGIHEFLSTWGEAFADCQYLVNNYGPITYQTVPELTAQDFLHDFHHNVITAFEVTRFFLDKGKAKANLAAVVNVGFEFLGEERAYRKILTYAMAKNALLLMTRAFEQEYPGIRFAIVSPPTLTGANVQRQGGKEVSPLSIAREIYRKIVDG